MTEKVRVIMRAQKPEFSDPTFMLAGGGRVNEILYIYILKKKLPPGGGDME